jgi:ATP-dependent RNA circularization protein (DNA/RNA ligase family)
MNLPFVKFPSTPHLALVEGELVRGDKLIDEAARARLLSEPVTVEEKVDGANVGISFDADGSLRLQNRGNLIANRSHPQFDPLKSWAEQRRYRLRETLGEGLMLFGEWCYARHTIPYEALPDYFLAFDVYDRQAAAFLSVEQRDLVLDELELAATPRLFQGRLGSLERLLGLLGPSRLGAEPMEGLYVRLDDGDWLALRAKLVRPRFLQVDEQHWSARPLERNRLRAAVGP